MKILLDENLPRILGKELVGHEVVTVQRAGWSGIENGRLLTLAQDQFDAFITADRNLQYQNVISRFKIALVLLRVGSTRIPDVLQKAPDILAALPRAKPGQVLEIL